MAPVAREALRSLRRVSIRQVHDELRVIYDTGHDIPRDGMIKESLSWLDRFRGSQVEDVKFNLITLCR